MIMRQYFLYLVLFLLCIGKVSCHKVLANEITAGDFRAQSITCLQSQTANTILVDNRHFIWISNRNGIDCYNGLDAFHYKLSDLGKRSYRDGMMIQLYLDYQGRVWAYTERGMIYQFDPQNDKFQVVVDLYSMEKYYSVQALYVTSNDVLVVGMNNGILSYDLKEHKLLSHVMESASVRSLLPRNDGVLWVGSDQGIGFFNIKTGVATASDLPRVPVQSMNIFNGKLWVGTNGRGLYYTEVSAPLTLTFVASTEDLIVNAIDYHPKHGLLLATDGQGLMQLDLDRVSHEPKTLQKIAFDSQDALFPTRSGAINDVTVDQGNIWFSMYMGGCVLLRQNHQMYTLTNPEAVSPSDNFVYDLDFAPDGDLWVAFNQSIVHYDSKDHEPTVYLNHESRFLTLKVRPDSTIWAGGFGSGLLHFDPKTGEKQWYPSICGSPTNDNIYAIHDTPDGDLWIGGLNMPLTQLHFLPNGSFETLCYYEIQQAFDVESLNEDTLAFATSDGFWLLDKQSGELSHHLQVGADHGWNGSNFVRSIITREGHEVWCATAGGGLVCYDTRSDHYDYYDSLAWLPSLELRSVLMLNDSILCASTESNGIFSFNCNSRQAERAIFSEDEMLQQEFLQNSGIRSESGTLFYGGDRGCVRVTASDILATQHDYWIFANGPSDTGRDYIISYQNRTLSLQCCVNDIYHQDDYHYYYRIPGYIEEWLPFTDGAKLRLVNLPSGDWELDLRAINSTQFELNKVCMIHVTSPIWLRWYAILGYVLFGIWIILKIVLYLLRPRIEDM